MPDWVSEMTTDVACDVACGKYSITPSHHHAAVSYIVTEVGYIS